MINEPIGRTDNPAANDIAGTGSIIQMLSGIWADIKDLKEVLKFRRKENFTVEEVAHLFNRTELTVRRWIAKKKIGAFKLEGTGPKGKWQIPRSELDKLARAGLGTVSGDAVIS